ncbi:MAG TPA: TlpA disulfide reductase family protein [Flavisolibacter sp.]|nr:TlpA disulfide reductase family protein [Flavisolibacter sp.]
MKSTAGHKLEKVDVFDLSQREIYDRPYRDTLVFHFQKTNIDCYNIRYHASGKMFRQQIWLDTGNVKIEGYIKDKELVIDTVVNSPFYYKVAAFNKQYSSIAKTHDTTAINDFLLAAFQENIGNPFSFSVGFYYVVTNQNQKLNLIKLKSIADGQGDKFNWFLLYPTVIGRINKILTVDRINVSNYSFLNLTNQKVQLPLKSADYFVLDFWFLACLPCVEQHAEIKKKLGQLRAKKVEVIGISTDSDPKKWRAYLAKHGYTWQNYLQDRTQTITKDLSISSFPSYVILNKAGEIVDTYNSFADVLKKFGATQ